MAGVMVTRRELETMVTQFKVSDLQSLLNFAGQNSKGRKTDLQRKVLNLIRHNISMPLELKIRTMYRQMQNEAQKQNDYYYRSNCDKFNNYYTNNNANGYATQSVASMSYDGYRTTNNYYQNQNGNNTYYDECLRKNNHLYTPLTNYNQSHSNNNGYQTSSPSIMFDYMSFLEAGTLIPEAKNLKTGTFKKLSFYRYDQTIVPLMPMKPQHKLSDVFDYTHSFTVGDQARNLLTWPKKDEKESRFQLQLRICLLDQATLNNLAEIADSLPLALTVKMNDKNCQLPPAIPSTNKQGMLLKRMNAPINITGHSSRKSQVNVLAINWSIECNKLYGFTVHLVEKYTSDELIERLKKTKQRDAAITKKYIHDQLDDDDDIAATSLKVSLICPLGKILMSLPARASTCNHVQCFDVSLYIKMNEVKSVWQCPICNSNCFYEDLFIDGYFVDILKSGRFSSNVNEVQINDDGSWEPVMVKKRKNSGGGESSSAAKKKRYAPDEPAKSPPSTKATVTRESNQSSSSSSQNTPPVLEDSSISSVSSQNTPAVLENSGISSVSSQNTPVVYEDTSSMSSAPESPPPGTSSSLDVFKASTSNNAEGESANAIEDNPPPIKTNVVLVDLTSDSESEESCPATSSSPLNLKKNEVNDLPVENPQPTSSSKIVPPPVYDIDDSDEHS
jgi:hypothetical protein